MVISLFCVGGRRQKRSSEKCASLGPLSILSKYLAIRKRDCATHSKLRAVGRRPLLYVLSPYGTVPVQFLVALPSTGS